ncbi:MAG TPA: lipopolysaccharide assembly protein LapA domain-containing protein [Acidimicrobiia bacterium]|nr:lipopolysaccharide assembly protein LapA domain-containing protein [Acidimicrobiia bacterium]
MVQRSPGDSPNGEAEGQARRLGGGAIASLTGGGLLLIFIFQNTDDVKLDFLFWNFTWHLWLLTLVSALLGALVWFGLGVMRRHRRRKARRADRRS